MKSDKHAVTRWLVQIRRHDLTEIPTVVTFSKDLIIEATEAQIACFKPKVKAAFSKHNDCNDNHYRVKFTKVEPTQVGTLTDAYREFESLDLEQQGDDE